MTPACTSATSREVPSPVVRISTRAQIVLTACGCAGASLFVFAVDPHRHSVYPQCLLYNLTGVYCAGCGATRAIYALLHGRGMEALHDNLLLVAALPLLLYIAGDYFIRAWRANAWPEKMVTSRGLVRWGIGAVGLMLAFMILRNLPGFEWLRPLP